WRGPMVNGAITQFIQDVDWGALDYLVFDLPPGTGDVQLTLVQTVPLTGAILVCTPQDVALLDAVKAQKMFEGTGVSILGYVENMSFLTCPHCRGRVDLFGAGGTERRAAELGVPFLGALPIDVAVRVGGDAGQPFMLEGAPASPAVEAMRAIAAATRERVRERMATEPAPRRVEMTRR
ncbi:MAG: P-loop NTPase, partial [Planctomycetes bacterium]|nr:P-loop NTPase [Planctomycetota bacterium]